MRTKIVFFLIAVLLITACSPAKPTVALPQAAVAVAGVGGGSKAQGILRLYPATIQGSPSQADLPAPGYPLGGKWSASGRYYAFILIQGQADTDIFRLDVQTGELKRLTNTPACPEIGLAWSADDQTIFFTGFCREGSQPTQFYRMAADGSNPAKLGEANYDAVWATYSPNLEQVALLATRPTGSEIQLAGVDGANLHPLAADASAGFEDHTSSVLDWSPDNQWLVFATHPITVGLASANQIIVIKPDGSERRVLVQPPAGLQCIAPKWSPDNKRVAFTCGPDLMIIQTDGSKLTNLTNGAEGRFAEYPSWAEEGKTLFFLSGLEPGLRRLERIAFDGSKRTNLGEIQAGIFYGVEWQPKVVLTAGMKAGEMPANAQQDEVGQPAQSEGVSPWLILFWLLVIGGLVAFFLYRFVLRSGRRQLAVLSDIRSSERIRSERRAARRAGIQQRTPTAGEVEHVGKPEDTQPTPVQPASRQSPEPVAPQPAAPAPAEVSGFQTILEEGITQARRGNPDAAIASLKAYLSYEENDSTAWLWLGFASGQRKDWRSAESCFRRAGKLGNPQAAEALAWLNAQRNNVG